jgi:hypothetical protein
MYKKILGKIRELFFKEERYDTSLRRQCIIEEYKDIFTKIRESNDLTKLLESRKLIRDFQQGTIDVGEEQWSRQYLMDLHRVWTIKYKYWKRNRSR